MVKLLPSFNLAKRMYSGVTGKVKAQKYVLTKYFQGEPKKTDFKVVEEELPELKDGEVLTEAEYLSVDPYMRAYMIGYKLPTDMIGGQVAKVHWRPGEEPTLRVFDMSQIPIQNVALGLEDVFMQFKGPIIYLGY